jgi:hypothetical protein
MKIIKYKQFNEQRYDKVNIDKSIEQDIDDIFIELKDEGIEVATKAWRDDKIHVTLYRYESGPSNESKLFNTKDTYEYVMMLIDYMNLKYKVNKVTYDVVLPNYKIPVDSKNQYYKNKEDMGNVSSYTFENIPYVMTDEFCISFWI